MNKMQRYVMLK